MKSIKIVYEYCTKKDGTTISRIEEAIVDFDGNNTQYVDSMSYSDNFDRFVHDAFSSGFIYLTPRKVVSVFQIKFFEFNDDFESEKDPISIKESNQPMDSNHLNREANKRKTRKNKSIISKNNTVTKDIPKNTDAPCN